MYKKILKVLRPCVIDLYVMLTDHIYFTVTVKNTQVFPSHLGTVCILFTLHIVNFRGFQTVPGALDCNL